MARQAQHVPMLNQLPPRQQALHHALAAGGETGGDDGGGGKGGGKGAKGKGAKGKARGGRGGRGGRGAAAGPSAPTTPAAGKTRVEVLEAAAAAMRWRELAAAAALEEAEREAEVPHCEGTQP